MYTSALEPVFPEQNDAMKLMFNPYSAFTSVKAMTINSFLSHFTI